MGFIHEDVGRVGIETRRESLVVHLQDDHPREPEDPYRLHSEGQHHPEFSYVEVLDLVEALMAPGVRERWDNPEVRAGRGWRPPAGAGVRRL